MVHLASTRYQGANHTHLSELLAEREGIDIGRTTLRRILLDAGLSSPRRRRPPKHRVRRQRMPRAGMLIQLDGSYHRWLGDHSPPFTLLLAVDDATGSVVNALFCQQEDSHHYFLLMQNLLRRRGIPLALYTDRHAVFKHTPGSGSTGTPTQFGRAMAELGIQMISVLSPQAKGRVERAAGTFQDRLITELRLAGATTMEQAKAVLKQFLPRFNRRFQVPAQCPDPAFRPLPPDLRLGQVLCFKHKRRVAKDNTVQFQRHTLQLLPDRQRRSYAGAAVVVLQGLDGRLSLQHEGRIIAAQEAPPSPGSLRNGIKPSSGDAIRSPDPQGPQCASRNGPRPTDNGSRRKRSRLRHRRCRRGLHDGDHFTQEADVSATGQVGRGAEGQARGYVHSQDGQRVGSLQRHRKAIHRCRNPADAAVAGNPAGIDI